ncbi:hypothetical protein [Rhizobium sp. No.120]
MQQLSLFDSIRKPPVIASIDPDGRVWQEDPDFTFRLAHPRMVWDRARIEIHRHVDGLWMWSTSSQTNDRGHCYKVGAKWGNFAESREDALFYACEEMERHLSANDGPDIVLIKNWVAALKDNPRAFA